MRYLAILVTSLALTVVGCAAPGSTGGPPAAVVDAFAGKVVVRLAAAAPGRALLAPVPQVTLADVAYVLLDLYRVVPYCEASPCEELQSYEVLGEGFGREVGANLLQSIGPIANADLGEPIVLTSLAPGETYELQAFAYDGHPDDEGSRVISIGYLSTVEFAVDSNGQATVTVPIKLETSPFNVDATATKPDILPGVGYAPVATAEEIGLSL